MNLKFNITPTRTNCFTPAQAAKVNAGIEIFQKVISSEEFQTKIKNFQWRTSDGIAFNRFYRSNGMSNQQVCDTICKGQNRKNMVTNEVENSTLTVINVMPCSSPQDVETCCNNTNTNCICIDMNVLNNSWYTPVHVACAIMHEWCGCNGFECCTMNTKMENWANNTVPVACAWICKDVCAVVCQSTEVTNWCNMISNQTFDYCACTVTYSRWVNTTKCISPVMKMDECINMMEQEMNWLSNHQNVTPDVTNRISVLTNCMNMINEMKINMCNTSLDGTDWACMPVNMVNTVNAN